VHTNHPAANSHRDRGVAQRQLLDCIMDIIQDRRSPVAGGVWSGVVGYASCNEQYATYVRIINKRTGAGLVGLT